MIPKNTIFEAKVCRSRFCDTILTGNQKMYCRLECGNNERRLLLQDGTRHLNIKRVDKNYSKTECKYCKDSNHNDFCCYAHEVSYLEIMNPIDKALGRTKQENAI